MPQLRSGKVVAGGEVAERVAARLSNVGAGVGCEPREVLVGKKSSRLALKRGAEQSLPSSAHPAVLAGVCPERRALLLPMQKEQVESQRLPSKKKQGIQCRVASPSEKGVTVQVPHTVVCENRVAGTCWEKTGSRRTGQGQQPFLSRVTLQKKVSAETGSLEGLNLSGFPEGSRSPGKNRKRSYMELKLQIPTSEEELDSTESIIPCLPEAEVLQPRNSACSTGIKGIGSLMILKLQIPDLKKSLGNEESSLSELQPWEVVDNPGKMNRCSLKGSEKTKEQGNKCLRKISSTSLGKSKLQEPRKRGGSALVELHTKCPESKKRAVSLKKRDSLHVQGVSGQEQPTARGKLHKRCVIEQQQSSDPQKGADSLGESGKHFWKHRWRIWASRTRAWCCSKTSLESEKSDLFICFPVGKCMCGAMSCRQEGVVCGLSQRGRQHAAGNLALISLLLGLGTLQKCEYQSWKKFLGRGQAFVEVEKQFSSKGRRPHKLLGGRRGREKGYQQQALSKNLFYLFSPPTWCMRLHVEGKAQAGREAVVNSAVLCYLIIFKYVSCRH